MITLEFLKPYIEKLTPKEVLCIFTKEDNKLIESILINKNNNYVEYFNRYFIRIIDFNKEYPLNCRDKAIAEVNVKILKLEEWFSLKKKKNYEHFMHNLKSQESNNEKFIYNNIKKDQGKFIKFDHGREGLLLTVVATDEDYYYAYLTKDKKIILSSCVIEYIVYQNEDFNNFITKEEIAIMLKKEFDSNNSDEVIIYRGMFDIAVKYR